MDSGDLTCIIEILGAILLAIAVPIIRNWASIRKSFQTMGKTTRETRPQWRTILTSILGTNLGYIILTGTVALIIHSEDPEGVKAFLIPASVGVSFFCAIPINLLIGSICGLLIYQLSVRRAIDSRASCIMSLTITLILGAMIAIPIYFLGLLVAAI